MTRPLVALSKLNLIHLLGYIAKTCHCQSLKIPRRLRGGLSRGGQKNVSSAHSLACPKSRGLQAPATASYACRC